MTNVTLSINNETYKAMKKFSEIKWSEFIRKAIQQRIKELNQIEKNKNQEGILTMLSSENVLKKDWDNEKDERWNNL
jgi:metal-responsive CopG/Arc/MetJ family transcriptional regulator